MRAASRMSSEGIFFPGGKHVITSKSLYDRPRSVVLLLVGALHGRVNERLELSSVRILSVQLVDAYLASVAGVDLLLSA